jgi:hypothetical protein
MRAVDALSSALQSDTPYGMFQDCPDRDAGATGSGGLWVASVAHLHTQFIPDRIA